MEQAQHTLPVRGDARKDYSYIKRHENNDPVLDRKVPVIELALMGVGIQAVLAYFLIRGLFIYGPLFGYNPIDCSETDFFLNQIYTIEIFNAFGAVVPVLVGLVFLAAIRILKRKKYGFPFLAAALLLILANVYVVYLCAQWYTTTSGKAITQSAETAIKDVAERQKQHFAKNGAYAADQAALGGNFAFAKMGTIKITSATAQGFTAEAEHVCLPKEVKWDSASGLFEKEKY
ncbi:MAG: hypothetical protein HZA04_05385 [Nitrospinae bacterium]|nr:hypothetical protein [Nitrospinota bacterium]